MPFTFAHPAIVLPLSRSKWFHMPALIVGSITPDFEYFFRMRVHSDCSHSPEGILWFNLPVGILLLLAYIFIVQKPLLNASPPFLQARIEPTRLLWHQWYALLICLLIGIGSHLLWDAFTHETGYFTQRIGWLRETHAIGSWAIPGFKIAQHSSTFVGLVVVAVYFFQLPKQFNTKHINWTFWSISMLVAITVVVLRFGLNPSLLNIGNLIVSSISAVFVGVLLASLVERLRFSKAVS